MPGEHVDLDSCGLASVSEQYSQRRSWSVPGALLALERGSVDMSNPVQDLGSASNCLAVARGST